MIIRLAIIKLSTKRQQVSNRFWNQV